MEDHQATTATVSRPKSDRLLGDIEFDASTQAPLGGINPYSPHFDSIGGQFTKLFIEHGGLTATSQVLDIGCGTGRMAKPLQQLLRGGRYIGFDINERFIQYCNSTYQSKMQFDLFDIQHDEYNPDGLIDAINFEFPYDSRRFDFVCAIAVFNHMYPKWVHQYLREVSRVLKPKGRLFCTAILLNSLSMAHIEGKDKHPFKFDYKNNDGWYDYDERPLFNVAVPENGVRRVLMRSGMMIKEPIRYGEWCASPAAITGHDVIIAIKGQWK